MLSLGTYNKGRDPSTGGKYKSIGQEIILFKG